MSIKNKKRFAEWMALKEVLHNVGRLTGISEGQIWWVAMGENVGVEINGKSELFSRPVLVYKKLSELGFLGVPLTSQEHEGTWYVPFEFQGKVSYAALAQIRVMSVARLYRKPIGEVSRADFKNICRGFDRLYHFDFSEDC